MSETLDLDSIRVLDRRSMLTMIGLAPRTWDRLEAIGDVPVKTQLSPGRVGYRVCDVKAWLDKRRLAANVPAQQQVTA